MGWGAWKCDTCGGVVLSPEAATEHEKTADHRVYWTYTHPSELGQN
jgi:hypothetical protein